MNSKIKIFVKLPLLFLFSVCAFSTNMVFAQSTVKPIAGIPIGLEGDPGSIIIARATTDVDGKFSCDLPVGKYKLKLSYEQITRNISNKDKNYASHPGGSEIDLMLVGANIKAPAKVIINKATGIISITVAKEGGTLIGTLTYVKVKSPSDQVNQKR